MSYDSDRIAFYTEFSTQWGSTTPIIFDMVQDDDLVTKGSSPWVNCMIEHFDTQQKSLGTSSVMYQTLGLFNVDIYDLHINGYADILRYADTIQTMFIGKHLDESKILVNRVSIMHREPYMQWISKRVSIHFSSILYIDR